MAENKQTITQVHENGTVMISEDVIITIVSQAVSEVEGVVGMSTKPGADIIDMIGKKSWGKGVKVVITEEDALIIDCNVLVSYGHSVVNVANAIQTAVASALENTIGCKVLGVNVNICGIVRG